MPFVLNVHLSVGMEIWKGTKHGTLHQKQQFDTIFYWFTSYFLSDDGNLNNLDGCSEYCTIEKGWHCDISTPSSCYAVCGNGILSITEQCDDGNQNNGDGCNTACQLEVGWTCKVLPTGNLSCVPVCGDGIRVGPGTFLWNFVITL
jgi:cysteine-rich repeat protein